jgi:sugar lactone lactonase YvrE
MKRAPYTFTALTIAALLLAMAVSLCGAAEVKVSYLYKLSNFTGFIPYASPKISVDRAKNEVYVLSGDGVSIFNSVGMEIYQTFSVGEGGMLNDAVAAPDGNIFTLTYTSQGTVITRCNYRLEPQQVIAIRNLPKEFAGFNPSKLKYHDGSLYLASPQGMTVVVTDLSGEYLKGYDLATALRAVPDEESGSQNNSKKRSDEYANHGFDGFCVDEKGNMLFVLPVAGKACQLTPEGKIELFGRRGNGAGKFGVPGGIAADKAGNYFVSDKLRNVVIVFDSKLNFVLEFNSLGQSEAYMTGPSIMDIDGAGRLYVGQISNRGVNVYQVTNNS